MPQQDNLWRPDGVPNFRGTDLPDASVIGSFLDELAVINDMEPLQFLLSMLANGRGLDPQLWEVSRTGAAVCRTSIRSMSAVCATSCCWQRLALAGAHRCRRARGA